MFCKKCGAEISDDAVICTKCGCATDNYNPVPAKPVDAKSGGFAVLGFFFPLIGFILWLIWKNEMPLRASSCGKGALIGVISVVLLWVICIVAGVSCVACMYPYYYY